MNTKKILYNESKKNCTTLQEATVQNNTKSKNTTCMYKESLKKTNTIHQCKKDNYTHMTRPKQNLQ